MLTIHKYCNGNITQIENYYKAISDNEHTYVLHHRAEILPCGCFKAEDLIKFGLYYKRPPSELIFLTQAEHSALHAAAFKKLKCGWFSKESHNKISKALTSRPSPFRGKKRQYSKEGLARISAANKGKTPWNKGKTGVYSEETIKKISNTLKGQPSPFKGKHHTEKSKKAFSESHLGMHWWNNGTTAKQARECPGEGWVLGRGKIKWRKTI